MVDEPSQTQDQEEMATTRRPAGSRLKVVTLSPRTVDSAQPSKGKRDPYLGATVDDRYKLEEVLGEGGMGVVYRCRHTIIDKRVAMKVLRADLARDEEVTERFLTEAKAASAIGNPHIIDISDFGRFDDGSAYFVMEFLDGVPLSQVVEEHRPVPVVRLLHIARQLAEGLSAAHNAGIIHRDLKPDNIFLVTRGKEKDFVKILDFGIAKVSTQGAERLTRAGSVFGTPHYMSPEQAAGAPVDHRGDIYSFGVILYELASGKVPFDADNFMGILTQHMYKAPVPIRALVPVPQDIPPGLEAIILKCLSKRTSQRYSTMDELLEDLTRLVDGLVPMAVPEMMARSGGFNVPADYFKKSGGAMPPVMPATPARPALPYRWPMYAGVAGVLFALGLVGTILVMGTSSDARTQTAPQSAAPVEVPTQQPAEDPPRVPRAKKIHIEVDPTSAVVKRDGQGVGKQPPMDLEIAPGDAFQLVVEAKGYEPQTVEINESVVENLVIALRPLRNVNPGRGAPAKPPPVVKPPTAAKSATPRGDGEIVDPWSR